VPCHERHAPQRLSPFDGPADCSEELGIIVRKPVAVHSPAFLHVLIRKGLAPAGKRADLVVSDL